MSRNIGKSVKWMAVLGTGLLVTTFANAQPKDRGLSAFDADKDGVVTAAEFKAGAEARIAEGLAKLLERYDANKDGTISAAESAAEHEADAKEHIAEMMERLDRNEDGVLDSKDLPVGRRGRSGKFPSQLDANGDNAVSADELAAAAKAFASKRQEEFLEEFDANDDGAVSSEEIRSVFADHVKDHVDAILARYDANKDGSVSKEEVAAANGERPNRPKPGNGGGARR